MFGVFGNPSKSKFAALVLQRIKEKGGPSDFVFSADEFEIRRGNSRGFLGNTYASYCHAKGAQRKMILENFVAAIVAQTDFQDVTLDAVRDRLVTVVRERALFSFTSLLWQLDGVQHPPQQQSEAISEWFAKALVVDAPSHMSLVNEKQVVEWRSYPEELYAIGLNKLKDTKPPAFSEERGVFRGAWADDYDSSRILVPGMFDDLPLRGDPVVAIPNRLTLLVAGSEDMEALRRMLATAEEIVRTQPRPQNPAPLLVQDGQVSDFLVPPTSPIYLEVERARRLAALLYYTEQNQNLAQLYEKKGKDLFVATYTLTQLESGGHVSHAVWTKGIPTLLPVVDEVIFVDGDRPTGQNVVHRASWPNVIATLGELMLDTKMFPRRYYVSTFPTAEQIAALG